MESLLTLAITTFRRPSSIRRLVELINKFNQYSNIYLSAVIVDASETPSLSLESKYIKYLHFPSVGMSEGFYIAACNVVTPYIQFFCDDDIFLIPNMASLLDLIRDEIVSDKYGSFVVQSLESDPTGLLTLRSSIPLSLDTNVKVSTLPFEDTVSLLDYLTYIGCLVVPLRSLSLSRASSLYFPHITWYFSRNSLSSLSVVANPVITITAGQASWKSNTLRIFNYYWPSSLQNISSELNPEFSDYLRHRNKYRLRRNVYYFGSFVLPVNFSKKIHHRFFSLLLSPFQACFWLFFLSLSILRKDTKSTYELLRVTFLSDMHLAKLIRSLIS